MKMKNLKNLQNYFTLVNSEKPPIFPIYPSLTPGNQSLTQRHDVKICRTDTTCNIIMYSPSW